MIKPASTSSNGVGGLVLLFCIAALLLGVLLGVLNADDGGFALASQPGSRAVLGAAVAIGAVLVAHGMRFVLGRARKAEEGDDAGPHA